MKQVKIKWSDAQSIDEWTHSAELCGSLAIVNTMGFLVKSTKHSYTVALNYDETNDNYSCFIMIPKKSVKEFRLLKELK